MSNQPYHNDASPAERLAAHRNEERVHKNTFHSHADSGSAGGRFAKQTPSITVGSKPWVEYPALPANSPWANEPVGLERPLGFSVEEMQPVGEPFELAESRGGEGIEVPPMSPPDDHQPGGDGPALALGNSSQRAEAAASSPPLRQRKRKR